MGLNSYPREDWHSPDAVPLTTDSGPQGMVCPVNIPFLVRLMQEPAWERWVEGGGELLSSCWKL